MWGHVSGACSFSSSVFCTLNNVRDLRTVINFQCKFINKLSKVYYDHWEFIRVS